MTWKMIVTLVDKIFSRLSILKFLQKKYIFLWWYIKYKIIFLLMEKGF